VKGLDDGPDGLNERAFDRALGLPRPRRRRTDRDDAWVGELIRRTVAASRDERR
jgi:hypothetical protein